MIVNWPLLRHPMNWIVVTLMVLIAGIAAHFLLQYIAPGSAPAAKPANS